MQIIVAWTIMQVVVDKCMHFANPLIINHLRARGAPKPLGLNAL
jgi:hypothetical protein